MLGCVTTVCVYVTGSERYGLIAREAARSVLDHSPFDVCFVHDQGLDRHLPRSSRLRRLALPKTETIDRADSFNGKLDAIALCIDQTRDDLYVMLDADAVFTRRIEESDIREAMGGRGLAMVEQKRIVGSPMGRRELFEHYCAVSLRFDAPDLPPPDFETFRYFNAGVILLERETASKALAFARERVRTLPRPHAVGEFMITDQDHLQVYANSIAPGSAAELPWYWNHCEHWDDGFPRADAWILHFSNFCNGPAEGVAERMRELQAGRWFWWNELVGRLRDPGPRGNS